eukprot:sb/3479663/
MSLERANFLQIRCIIKVCRAPLQILKLNRFCIEIRKAENVKVGFFEEKGCPSQYGRCRFSRQSKTDTVYDYVMKFIYQVIKFINPHLLSLFGNKSDIPGMSIILGRAARHCVETRTIATRMCTSQCQMCVAKPKCASQCASQNARRNARRNGARLNTVSGLHTVSTLYTVSTQDRDARMDIVGTGLWQPEQLNFFDVRVVHANSASYLSTPPAALYRNHEQRKKRTYMRRVQMVEGGSFTPLIMSTTGGLGDEFMKTLKKAASRIEDKHGERYPEIMATIKQKLRFSILRSTLRSLRGCRYERLGRVRQMGPYGDLIRTRPCLVAYLRRMCPEVVSWLLCTVLPLRSLVGCVVYNAGAFSFQRNQDQVFILSGTRDMIEMVCTFRNAERTHWGVFSRAVGVDGAHRLIKGRVRVRVGVWVGSRFSESTFLVARNCKDDTKEPDRNAAPKDWPLLKNASGTCVLKVDLLKLSPPFCRAASYLRVTAPTCSHFLAKNGYHRKEHNFGTLGGVMEDRKPCLYVLYEDIEKQYHIEGTGPDGGIYTWLNIELNELGRIEPIPSGQVSDFYEIIDLIELRTKLDGNGPLNPLDEILLLRLQEVVLTMEVAKEGLEEVVMKYKSEIKKNPEFRAHFQVMCSKIGVDPLASSKGFWAQLLGVGDFYYELGVQIVEVCLATRPTNGGLITVEELCNKLGERTGGGRRRVEKELIGLSLAKESVLAPITMVNTYALKKTLLHLATPYFILNGLVALLHPLTRFTPGICDMLFNQCELDYYEIEIYFFVICVVAIKNRRCVSVESYLSTLFMFAKAGSCLLFYKADIQVAGWKLMGLRKIERLNLTIKLTPRTLSTARGVGFSLIVALENKVMVLKRVGFFNRDKNVLEWWWWWTLL